MNKARMLRQIANTIVANLENTEPIGLFDGKTGLCLFLYRYARYSGCDVYGETADGLLDEVLRSLKPDLSPSLIDGSAGIGYAVAALLRDGFLSCEAGDDVLRHFDETLLLRAQAATMQEVRFPIPLFSTGLYLLSRMEWQAGSVRTDWRENVCRSARQLVDAGVGGGHPLKWSLLNSLLYVCGKLYSTCQDGKKEMESWATSLPALVSRTLDAWPASWIEAEVFKGVAAALPPTLRIENAKQLCQRVAAKVPPAEEAGRMDEAYEQAWWGFVYGQPFFQALSTDQWEEYLEQKMLEAHYDERNVNSRLAACGLQLMQWQTDSGTCKS